MNFFEWLKQNLFSSSGQKAAPKQVDVPFIQEEIEKRRERFMERYHEWCRERSYKVIMSSLQTAFQESSMGRQAWLSMYQHRTPYSNGLYFPYKEGIDPEEFHFLFELMKDRVLELGYKHYNTDREIRDLSDRIETVETHFLKPPVNKEVGNVTDQIYGNILLEHNLINEQPNYIKMMAHIHSDSMKNDPKPFDELVSYIFRQSD